jgi:hypothetical protein
VLDYLEQEDLASLYENWGGNDTSQGGVRLGSRSPRYGDAPNLENVSQKRVATMTCPSDTPNRISNQIANHNYVVNLGNVNFGQGGSQSISFQGVPFLGAPFGLATFVNSDPAVLTATTGGWLVRQQKGKPLNDVLDGLSNTLMMAECVQGKGNDFRGTIWWGNGAAFTAFYPPNTPVPDNLQSGCVNLPSQNLPCILIGNVPNVLNPYTSAARSMHPQGVQVVACDGSATFISQNIAIDES